MFLMKRPNSHEKIRDCHIMLKFIGAQRIPPITASQFSIHSAWEISAPESLQPDDRDDLHSTMGCTYLSALLGQAFLAKYHGTGQTKPMTTAIMTFQYLAEMCCMSQCVPHYWNLERGHCKLTEKRRSGPKRPQRSADEYVV
jgi:hypothetical protein